MLTVNALPIDFLAMCKVKTNCLVVTLGRGGMPFRQKTE